MKDAMGMQSSETLDLSFDPFDGSHDLREGYYDNYIDANSDEEIAYINQRIDRELLNEEILSTAPLPVAMAMGVLDPVNLLPLSVLGKGKTVAGTAARFAGTTALTETAVEGVLHDAQETRTLTESLINIGAGSILAGTLGAAAKSFSQIDPTFDMNKLVRDADNQLKELADGSVGAARVADRATLEQLGPAEAALRAEKAFAFQSPVTRMLRSPTKAARDVVGRLAEINITRKGAAEGEVAAEIPVENWIKQWDYGRYIFSKNLDDLFQRHRTGNPQATSGALKALGTAISDGITKPAAGKLTRAEFNEEVAKAARS